MKNCLFRTILFTAACLSFLSSVFAAAPDGWREGFTDEARAEAEKEKRFILLFFTGSDWCIWCVRLHDEVLSQPAFKEYAAKNLVLLLVDFPNKKPMTKEQKAANNALAQKYGIRSFPTILILNSDGQVLAKTGYRRGGAAAYVNHLKNILK